MYIFRATETATMGGLVGFIRSTILYRLHWKLKVNDVILAVKQTENITVYCI